MKFFKVLLMLVVFAGTTFSLSANTPGPKEDLEKQLSNIITKAGSWGKFDGTVQFEVKLMINNDGEIIVLSTTNKSYDRWIKGLLNYRKITVSEDFKSVKIILPIKLENR